MPRHKLSPKQRQLYGAIKDGAKVSYKGWQQVYVDFGPKDPRNYTAMQSTLYALRDRGLIELGVFGARLRSTDQNSKRREQ